MAQVTVKSKFGQLGTIDKNDLSSALTHGFSLATDNEVQDHNDQMEHGSGMLNPLIAGAEEAAGTATFGLSRELENATGITTPEAQAARAKYNPGAKTAGTVAGLIADPFGLIGKTSKLGGKAAESASKLIGVAPEGAGALARAARAIPSAAVGFGTEGLAYGVGNSITEHALGDPDLNAEKILSNVGYSGLLSAGLGAAFEGGMNVFGKSTLKSPLAKMATEDASKVASYQDDITQGVNQNEAANGISQAPLEGEALANAPFKEFPKSLDEIKQAVKTNFPIAPEGMPSYNRLKEINEGLPDLQFKPHALQMESLTDQGLRDYYKTFAEGQSPEAKALRDYEALQKQEALQKLDNTISELSPKNKVTSDPVQGGENAIKSFADQYEAEKKELIPHFQRFDEIAGKKNINGLNPILKLHDLFPQIGEYLNSDAEGVFKLSRYSPEMPFSKNTYGAIKDLISAANQEKLSLSGLRNVRESMRDRLTLTAGPRDEAQIGSIRKMLMDEMQEGISKVAPEMEVRDVFRRYAQNEEQRAVIEKIMGGSISDKASFAKTIKPEDVLSKIFSSTVSVNAAKEVLGKDFKQVLADYLAHRRSLMTDEARNGFSSNKFSTFMRGKSPELTEAFSGKMTGVDPSLKRLTDLTDYMRILPDAPSSNPSGTAKTLGVMEKIAGLSRSLSPKGAIEEFANKYLEKTQAAKQRYTIDEILAGKHFGAAQEAAEQRHIATSGLAKVERMAEAATYRITQNAKAIFDTAVKGAQKSIGILGSKLAPSKMHKPDETSDNRKVKDVFARINELEQDPEKMMNHLVEKTAALYGHAPMITQGLQTSAVRATSFLASKLPPMLPQSPFTHETYEPSKSELSNFERYYNLVEDPMLAMDHVRNNSVTPETVETLSTVYPKLYDQMKVAIMDQVAKQVGKKQIIPYQTKQSISMFVGEPLDQSMTPQVVMANQQAYISNPQAPMNNPKPSKPGMRDISLSSRTSLKSQDQDA